MKYIKRTLALLLAVVLVLALSISAFAVDTNGSIKVDNAVVNKTYTLYRIFDLDSHNTDYSAINYKVSAKWANFFVTGAEGLNYVTIDDMGYVTWKDGANAADFAAAAIAYATANGIANDGQQKATGSIVEFTNLPLGYYLVQSDLGALCSLDTTMPNVTIKEKNGKPTVDKEVEENGVYGKTNDANIGDTVNFKTTITVTDGNPVAYILHDKMSAGLTFVPNSVTVKVNGKEVKINSPLDAMKQGMAYLPEDRKKDGILADLSVRENIIIALQAKRGMFHPMSRKEMEEAADKYIDMLQIKTASRETPIKSLSGGNQQKVIIGRWLLTNPDYLILDEPTRGIDIGTKTEIQKLVLDLADQGMAVTFISSEVEEMLRTCSRMGVLRDGKKVGEISGDQLTQEGVMKAIAGGDSNE